MWIATAGGAGYFPMAPGTVGSLVGLAVVVALGKYRCVGPLRLRSWQRFR